MVRHWVPTGGLKNRESGRNSRDSGLERRHPYCTGSGEVTWENRQLSLVTSFCYDPRPPFQVDPLIWIRPAKLPHPNGGSVLNDARQPPHAQSRSCASLRHGQSTPRLTPPISRTRRST